MAPLLWYRIGKVTALGAEGQQLFWKPEALSQWDCPSFGGCLQGHLSVHSCCSDLAHIVLEATS